MLIGILAVILGSLGLMFIGNRLIGTNIALLSGGYIQKILHKFTSNPAYNIFWGTLLGFLVQSTSAMIFMSSGLVASQAITFSSAILLSLWSNVGSSLTVFNLLFSSKSLAYFLLGIAGFSTLFHLKRKGNYIRELILGFGMLYLGLNLLIPAIKALENEGWIINLFHQKEGIWTYIAFWYVGLFLSIFVHGSVPFLAYGFASAGVLPLNLAIFLIYGNTVGGAIYSIVATSQPSPLMANSIKLSVCRLISTLIGSLVFTLLFAIEEFGHVPLVKAFLRSLTSDIGNQIAILIVLYNTGSTFISTLGYRKLESFVHRHIPLIQKEDPSKPKFIYKEAVNNPENALNLLEKEEIRLLNRIGKYLEGCRNRLELNNLNISQQHKQITHEQIMHTQNHHTFLKLATAIQAFQQDMTLITLSEKLSEKFLNLVDRHNLIMSLEESLYQLTDIVYHTNTSSIQQLLVVLVESLDVILSTALNALESEDSSDVHLLIEITHDRKAFLDQLRDSFLRQDNPPLTMASRASVLVLTNLSERIVWLFRRISILTNK